MPPVEGGAPSEGELTCWNPFRPGRSDGVMNIGSLRVGPAEIYTILVDLPELGASSGKGSERAAREAVNGMPVENAPVTEPTRPPRGCGGAGDE